MSEQFTAVCNGLKRIIRRLENLENARAVATAQTKTRVEKDAQAHTTAAKVIMAPRRTSEMRPTLTEQRVLKEIGDCATEA